MLLLIETPSPPLFPFTQQKAPCSATEERQWLGSVKMGGKGGGEEREKEENIF